MRRFLPLLIGAALVGVVGAQVVQACGDKFLLVGRGVSFRRAYAAIHPASIVLFAEPQFGASTAFRDADFQRDLKLAGHTIVVVSAEQEFQNLLKTQKVDLVLVDYADAERVRQFAATTQNKPTVMEVMTAAEAKKLPNDKKKFLKSTDNPVRFLEDIDDVMKTRVGQAKGR